jgi:hypothetical protein
VFRYREMPGRRDCGGEFLPRWVGCRAAALFLPANEGTNSSELTVHSS